MSDRLTLKRQGPDSYSTVYEHPKFGNIAVGFISARASHGNIPDNWQWAIRIGSRPALGGENQGTAATLKAATAAWKAAWPRFRDLRTDDQWHDFKSDQVHSEKKLMIYDAYKLPGVTPEIRERLQHEMGRGGAAPDWLVKMLERGTAA